MPSDLETLQATRELIARGWTRNTSARNDWGYPCSPMHSHATSFCLVGAVTRAASGDENALSRVIRALAQTLRRDVEPALAIAVWNDEEARSAHEVIQVIDLTIQKLQSEESHDN